jgi:hypothetical protein
MFTYAFASSTLSPEAAKSCHLSDQPPDLTDLGPIIIHGTAAGDGSTITGNARACLVTNDDEKKDVASVLVTWHLTSRPSCSSQGAQGTGAMGGATLPALTVPGVSARSDTRAMHLGDIRVAQGFECRWYGTITVTVTWTAKPYAVGKQTFYADWGQCVSELTYSPPDKVTGQQRYDRWQAQVQPEAQGRTGTIYDRGLTSNGWKFIPAGTHGSISVINGALYWTHVSIPIDSVEKEYWILAGQLQQMYASAPRPDGSAQCYATMLGSAFHFDPKNPNGRAGPYKDAANNWHPSGASATIEYHLHWEAS